MIDSRSPVKPASAHPRSENMSAVDAGVQRKSARYIVKAMLHSDRADGMTSANVVGCMTTFTTACDVPAGYACERWCAQTTTFAMIAIVHEIAMTLPAASGRPA